MIVVQHKNTHEVQFVSVGEWMTSDLYDEKVWRLIDIESVVRIYYKGKRSGFSDLKWAQEMAGLDTAYTYAELNTFDYFVLLNRKFFRGWKKLTFQITQNSGARI